MNDVLWGLIVAAACAVLVHALVRPGAEQRHARYVMRAKLAQWLMEGRLKPVGRVKNGRILHVRRTKGARHQTKRPDSLSVLRGRDSGSGSDAA